MKCCVEGCENDGTHHRVFTIGAQFYGETEATVEFCCEHLDHLQLETRPYLDLTVAGVFRAE